MKFIVANAISLHSDKWEMYAFSSAGADASMKCSAHWLLIKCYGIEIVNVTLHIALIVVVIVVVVAGCHCNSGRNNNIFGPATQCTEWRRGVRQKPQRQHSLPERHKSKPTHYLATRNAVRLCTFSSSHGRHQKSLTARPDEPRAGVTTK